MFPTAFLPMQGTQLLLSSTDRAPPTSRSRCQLRPPAWSARQRLSMYTYTHHEDADLAMCTSKKQSRGPARAHEQSQKTLANHSNAFQENPRRSVSEILPGKKPIGVHVFLLTSDVNGRSWVFGDRGAESPPPPLRSSSRLLCERAAWRRVP